MKKLLYFLFIIPQISFATPACFLMKDLETGKTLTKEGMCDTASAPNSTFKVALAVMGFDSKILTDKNNPKWPYQKEYQATRANHKKAQTPVTWMENSPVWYSRILTSKLGAEKFKSYVDSFDYGNKDISGDKGKNNGLTNAWLSSSLQITPNQQIDFLIKLIKGELPVRGDAMEKTREIMFIETLSHGWKLYGKTGTGYVRKDDGSLNLEKQTGYFVGWVSKGKQAYVFARRIFDEEKNKTPAGPRAKDELKKLLLASKLLN